MNNLLATLYILFSLLVLAQAKGNLFVDTIYSSGNERVIVDHLYSDHATITTLESEQIGFGTFDSLSVSAPGLDLAGSFLSMKEQNDIIFESTENDISLSAAHHFEVASSLVTLLANEVTVNGPGVVEFTALNAVLVNGNQVNIMTGNGGVNFQATAGDLEITSVGAMNYENWNLVLDTTGDIITATSGDSVYVAEEEIVAFSENKFYLQSQGDQNFISSEDSITFSGDYNTIATGSLTANGFDTASLESINNEIRVFGYNGVLFQGDGITVQGETDGVDVTVSGDEDGGVYVTANEGDINLLTTSSSDTSEIRFEISFFALELDEDVNINSVGETRIDSQFNLAITNDLFTVNMDRDGWVHADGVLTFNAGTTFGVTANTIFLKATDPGLPTNNDGLGKMEVTAGDIVHGVSGVSRALYISSNDLLIDAGLGGITFNARDTEFLADYTLARDQVAYLRAKDLDVSKSTADLDWEGGEIYLKGKTAAYTIATDLNIKAVHEESSEVQFLAPLSDWTVRRWTHTTGTAAFAPPTMGTSTQEIINFQSIDYVTGPFYDITGLFADLQITTSDRLDLVAPRDISLSSSGLTSFTSQASTLTSSSLSLNADTDNLRVDSATNIVWSGQNAMVTTYRDEDSSDSLSYLMTGTVNIGPGAYHYHGLMDTQFNSLGFYVQASNIELSSGDFSDALFTAGTNFNFDITSSLNIRGNSLSWEAGAAISATASNTFQFLTYAHGLDGFVKTDLEVFPTSALTISVYDEARLLADANVAFTTQSFTSNSAEDLWIHSDQGSVTFTVNALNSQLNVFGNNITVATGDHPGNTFNIQATHSSFSSTESTYIDVSHGPLTFKAGIASWNSGDFQVHSEGDVLFSTGSLQYSFDNGVGDFFGGSIDIKAPSAALSIISDNLLTINSTDASVGGFHLDNLNDGLQFTAAGNMIFQNDPSGNMVFFSNQDLSVLTSAPGTSGAITLSGQNVDVSSFLENQDIHWHAATTLTLSVTDDTSITSGGDWWINTKQASKFQQANAFVQIHDDFQISSEQREFLITQFGDEVLLQARSLDQATEDNYVMVNSTQRGTFDAGNGLSFTSFGSSAARRLQDGDSNSEMQFDSDVGFSVRTYADLGDIVVQALQNKISLNSGETTQFKSAAVLYVDTLYQQGYTAGIHTTFAEDGTAWYRGATGISVSAGQNLNFMASQFGSLFADESVEVLTDDDWDLVSYHSNILVKTYERNDVVINAGRDIDFTAAMGIDVIANGDLDWFTGLEWNVQADRGYSLTTTEEGISYTSKSSGSTPNTVQSAEELGVLAGGDLVLGNAGVGGENMRFTGSRGVVFSTRAGNINVDTDTTTISGSTVEFNSIGSSSTNRDRVLFHAETTLSSTSTGRTFLDATELISIGQDNNRAEVSIEGTGTEDAPGVVYNVAGNFEINTNAQFHTTAGKFNLTTVASTSLTAVTVLNLQSAFGSVNVNADTGVISLRAGTDFLETATTAVSSRSGELNLYYTGTASFTSSQQFVGGAAYFNNIIDGSYTATIASLATYETNRPDGTMDWEIAQALTTVSTAAGASFSADQFLEYTLGNDFLITNTGGAAKVTIDEDVPGHILYNTNQFDITTPTTATITGRKLDFLVPSLTGNLNIDSDLATVLASNDLLFSTNSNAQYTATDADYTINDSFRVLATESISVVASNTQEFNTVSNEIRVQPGSGGSMQWTGTTFLHNGQPSVVNFVAGGGLFSENAPQTIQLTATAGDIDFTTTARAADILVNSVGAITFTATATVFSQSGDATSTGNTVASAPALVVGNAGSLTLDFITGAQDVATASPINVVGTTLSADVGAFTVVADSPVPQEGQGTIQITGPVVDLDAAGGAFNIISNEAKITTEVRGDTEWNVGGGNILFNTNGINGGVRFDSDSFDLTAITTTLNVAAGRQTLISASSDNAASVNFAYPTTTIVAGATAGIADSNIQFQTEHENGAIALALTTLATDADHLQISAQVSATLSAVTTHTFNAGGSADLIADGVFINTGTGEIFGLRTTSTTVLNIGLTATDLEFSAQDTFSVGVTGDGVIATTNTFVDSVSDLGFVMQSLTAPKATFTSHSNGITLANPNTIAVIAADDISFEAGLYEDESKILLSTTTFGASTATGIEFVSPLLSLEADSNIQIKSRTAFMADIEGPISMVGLKGDILFRSVSLDTDGAQDGPFDLMMESAAADPGITFNTFYRFAHRQHLRLAVFNPGACPNRPAAPDNNSAQQQPTTEFNLDTVFGYADGCECVAFNGADCANVACPDTTARVEQLQEAMIALGLLFSL